MMETTDTPAGVNTLSLKFSLRHATDVQDNFSSWGHSPRKIDRTSADGKNCTLDEINIQVNTTVIRYIP